MQTLLPPDAAGRTAAVPELESGLVLLQLMDSSFPVGSFTHSYGLEQAVRDGIVRDAGDVERFVAAAIEWQASDADRRAVVRAHAAAVARDRLAILDLDAELHATKAAAELRAASTSTGRRLLQEVVASPESGRGAGDLPAWYLAAIESGRGHGVHPVALGVVGASFGVPSAQLAAAFLFATASTMHQAAMRLLPVSHRDMQAALHRARARIVRLTAHGFIGETHDAEHPFESFAPLHEIASMRHERAAVRFFAS